MNLKNILLLGLLLPGSGSLQAQEQRPAVQVGAPDAAQEAVTQALKLREAGQFAEAQALLEVKLKDLHLPAQQKELQIALADVHFGWARNVEAQSRYLEAIQHFEAAYVIDKVLRPHGAAFDLYNIGGAYHKLGRSEEALRSFQQALPLLRELKNRSGEAYTLNFIGSSYNRVGRSEEALSTFQQALPILRELKDRQGEAMTLNDIGSSYDSLGRSDEALSSYQQALPIKRELNDRPGEAKTLSNIAAAYEDLSRYEEALSSYQQSLPIFREVKDQSGEATTLNNIGAACHKLGRYEQALSYYQQSLPIFREIKDRSGEAHTLTNIGNSYYRLRRSEEALSSYQRALPVVREVKDRQREAAVLTNIGDAYYSLSRNQEALNSYQQALPIFWELKDRQRESKTFTDIGDAYYRLGRSEEALSSYQGALLVVRELKDRQREAAVLINIGDAYYSLSRNQEALNSYQQALPIFRELKDRQRESKAFTNIGFAYHNLGRNQEALSSYQQALRIDREISDRNGEAYTLTNIGAAYENLSRYGEALSSHQQALPILRELKDRGGEAYTLNNMGLAYDSLSRPEEALRYFQQALPIFRELKERKGEATTLNNIGLAYRRLGRLEEALSFYQQVLPISRELRDRRIEAIVLANIGAAYENLSRYGEALSSHQQALRIYREINDRSGEATVLNNMAFAYNSLSRYEEALSYYQQALPILREVQDRQGEANTLNNLLDTWQSLNKPRLAIFYGKQSVNAYQDVRRNIQGLDKETQRGFLQSKENIYRNLADLLIKEGRLAEAQQVLEMLKEEEFFQYVRRDATQATADTRATLNSAEAEWEKRYQEIADRISLIAAEYGRLDALKTRTQAQEQRMDELKRDLDVAKQASDRFFTKLRTEFEKHQQTSAQVINLPKLEALQGALREIGPDVAIMSTVVGPDDYSVILMTAHSMQGFKNPKPVPATEIRTKVSAFIEAISKSRLDPRPTAHEMYKIVFCQGAVTKALQDAGIKTLLWSLDDVLRYAPLSALHDGDKYLVEKYTQSVITLTSHSRLKDEPKQEWTGLGLGVSKARPNFQALPGVVAEMKAIIHPEGEEKGEENVGGVLPGTVALDEAFTLQALERGLRRRPQLVHIASHFEFKPGDETNSFLLLGDGTLSLDKLKRLDFNGVDLLTLSACNTASGGKDADGREVEGFAEQAQIQGADAVMATLWPVADASTPLLMNRFYRGREGGRSKAEALRQAQLALLHGTEHNAIVGAAADANRSSQDDERAGAVGAATNFPAAFAHPYFWAPFVLIGNSR
jgi:tetratricopeptide (TPR) repeat protein